MLLTSLLLFHDFPGAQKQHLWQAQTTLNLCGAGCLLQCLQLNIVMLDNLAMIGSDHYNALEARSQLIKEALQLALESQSNIYHVTCYLLPASRSLMCSIPCRG